MHWPVDEIAIATQALPASLTRSGQGTGANDVGRRRADRPTSRLARVGRWRFQATHFTNDGEQAAKPR